MLFSLFLCPTHLKSQLGRHWIKDIAVLGHGLVTWLSSSTGLACTFPAGPTRAKTPSRLGEAARDPPLLSLPRHIPLSTRPDARWPEKPPFCSLFHNILMKCGSKGHQQSYTTSHFCSIKKLKQASGSSAAQRGDPVSVSAP